MNALPNGLAQPALRALASANCHSLEEVARLSERELRRLHGIGPKAVELLLRALALQGLKLRDEA